MADREAVVVTPIAAVAADAASQLAGTQPPGSEGWASTVADGVTQAVADTPPVVAEPSDAADTDAGDERPPAEAPPPGPPAKFVSREVDTKWVNVSDIVHASECVCFVFFPFPIFDVILPHT